MYTTEPQIFYLILQEADTLMQDLPTGRYDATDATKLRTLIKIAKTLDLNEFVSLTSNLTTDEPTELSDQSLERMKKEYKASKQKRLMELDRHAS